MLEVGLVAAVVLAALVARWILKRGSSDDGHLTPVRPMVPPSISLSKDLQDQLRTTAIRGNPDLAIKELRRQTGMSELDASAVIHAILAGRIFPFATESPGAASAQSPTPVRSRRREAAPIDAELLAMLRDLVAQDPTHRAAAVMLLRQHTGMAERDARRFVEAL